MVVRRMIETDVIELLMAEEGIDFAGVESALAAMGEARDAQDFARFTEADAAFHRALVHAAENPILSVFYDNLYGLVTEVIRVTSRVPTKSYEAAYAEHEALYRAIRGDDVDAARALMRAHIENSADYLRLAIERANAGPTPD